MSKYKLTFKGLDDDDQYLKLKKAIIAFYKTKMNNVVNRDFGGQMEIDWEDNLREETTYVDFENREIAKYTIIDDQSNFKIIPFTKDELKFFDSLDFELSDEYYDQSITDWWNA